MIPNRRRFGYVPLPPHRGSADFDERSSAHTNIARVVLAEN
jgi:hypothetical protein